MLALLAVVSTPLMALPFVATPIPLVACDTCNFILKWSSTGTGNGNFSLPVGVAVDSSGNVYVVDDGNNRVEKFTSGGTYLSQLGSGQLTNPYFVAVDSAGNVYVTDTGNSRVEKFNSIGTSIKTWGFLGSGDGQFQDPFGIALDSGGNVYVVDNNNDRVQKFNGTGTFITKWGSFGPGNGQFSSPFGVAVDSSGNVYVVDTGNNCVELFGDTTHTLTATVSVPANSGTLDVTDITKNNLDLGSCSGNRCVVAVGDSLSVAASPADGYQFSSWSTQPANLCGNTSPCAFPMPSSDVSLTATFTLIPPPSHTLTAKVDAGSGSVTVNGNDCSAGCSLQDGSSVCFCDAW